MKNTLKQLHSALILILFIGFVASCGNKKNISAYDAAKNITAVENPDFIMSVATGEVINKSGIKGDAVPMMMQMLFGEMLDYVRKEDKTGISFEGSSYMLLKMGNNGKPDYIASIFNIKDAERFKSFIKEETSQDAEKKEGINYYTEGKNFITGWYKTFGVSLISDNISTKDSAFLKIKSLMETATKTAENLGKNYTEFFNQKADISIIYNLDIAGKINQTNQNDEQLKKMKTYYEGGSAIYTLNFETDKINGNLKNMLSDKSVQRFSQMFNKGISEGMTQCLTDNGNLIAFGSMAINLGSFMDFLTEIGLNEGTEVKEFEYMTQLSFSDFAKAFTGEVTISLIDIEQVNALEYYKSKGVKIENPEYFDYTKTLPKVAITVGLNSDLIKNVFDTTKNLDKQDNIYSMNDDVFLSINGNKLFISTHKDLAEKFAANGYLGTYNESTRTSQAMANPFYGYLNFAPLKKLMSEEDLKNMEDPFNYLNYATFSANLIEGTFEINFKPTGKNSLALLTGLVFDLIFANMESGI